VNDHVEAQRQIERARCERQRGDIGLRQVVCSQTLPVAQALPGDVDGKHAQPVARSDDAGKAAGSATSLKNAPEGACPGNRIEHTEQDLPHAPIPPEILLGRGNVGELGRIHHPTFILNSWALQFD
jgi:hypothetical protein